MRFNFDGPSATDLRKLGSLVPFHGPRISIRQLERHMLGFSTKESGKGLLRKRRLEGEVCGFFERLAKLSSVMLGLSTVWSFGVVQLKPSSFITDGSRRLNHAQVL